MLNRVQSKSQADRHNKDEKVEQCNRILEKLAMKMQVQRSSSVDATDFEKQLKVGNPELIETWVSLKTAVVAGHAVFLRVSFEGELLVHSTRSTHGRHCMHSTHSRAQHTQHA